MLKNRKNVLNFKCWTFFRKLESCTKRKT